jgi:ABC-type antimicrobial peptide transport system permease subunit
VDARDPVAIAVALAAFGSAGLLAIWWPARRAAATDPAIALRSE